MKKEMIYNVKMEINIENALLQKVISKMKKMVIIFSIIEIKLIKKKKLY